MRKEAESKSPSDEQLLTDVVDGFLSHKPWEPERINDLSGAVREVSVVLPGQRLLYVSQRMFDGELGVHNLVQVMNLKKGLPPVNKHIGWHERGSELKEALIEQPFDVEEILLEGERFKNGN